MDCQLVGNSGCFNEAFGNDNTQSMDLQMLKMAAQTIQSGSDNTQNINCDTVGLCLNNALGNNIFSNDKTQDTQNIDCERVGFRAEIAMIRILIAQLLKTLDAPMLLLSAMKILKTSIASQLGILFCTNIAQDSNDDTQNIYCFSVGNAGCFNGAVGDGNIQNMKCNSVGDAGCQNSVNQNPEKILN